MCTIFPVDSPSSTFYLGTHVRCRDSSILMIDHGVCNYETLSLRWFIDIGRYRDSQAGDTETTVTSGCEFSFLYFRYCRYLGYFPIILHHRQMSDTRKRIIVFLLIHMVCNGKSKTKVWCAKCHIRTLIGFYSRLTVSSGINKTADDKSWCR